MLARFSKPSIAFLHMPGFAVHSDSDANPPSSNTGGDCPVECGIDYLRGTVPIRYSGQARDLISACFKVDFVLSTDRDGNPLGTSFYKMRFETQHHISFLAINRSMADASSDQHCLIDISGQALERLTSQQLHDFFIELALMQFHCTRIDLKIDDFTKTVSPFLAMRASQVNNKTGFRRFNYRQDDRNATTFYAGVRGRNGGGKFVRIYDKYIQSNGDVDSVRIELEASAQKALDIFCDITTIDVSLWPSFIIGVLDSSISFIDRAVNSRVCRAPKLSWWSWLFDGSVSFSFSRVVKASVLSRTKKWLENQVSSSLAAVVCATIGEFNISSASQMFDALYPLLIDGLDGMTQRHKQMIRQHWLDEGRYPSCDIMFRPSLS